MIRGWECEGGSGYGWVVRGGGRYIESRWEWQLREGRATGREEVKQWRLKDEDEAWKLMLSRTAV